ncbi:MAG: iron transporter [Tistrella sp.]|uniref:Iron permease FTR1 n=2 Tax=Tistrella mobilis TaxID=171437 RepID=I3TWN1_TISMK|nr:MULTISPECIES: iron uptake transporter permease EfeU [Tistrella]AFK57169.1 iron permease FTR1 [Tistrella mobilis KA081020-065]MAD39875.1 iron transporter [Tistrella sp.]MBA76887.1 iron transporter [Tistrella sp.]HAE46697.1 iron transporter [Tistrella mobilis]
MLAPFLIMLREGLEAALIVGIIAGYLRQTGRRDQLPAVWVGIFLAAAMALFTGAALQMVSAGFPQKAQELFEAVVGIAAVVVLVAMVFWMRRAAKSIRRELHAGIDQALAAEGGRAAGWALIGMVFFAVAREGLESVFFLLAIFQQSRDAAAPLGALAGIAVSAGIGWAIYRGGLRLNLARFFRWTGVVILFVAAGLLAGALKALHEAGLWNGLQGVVYDLGRVLPESGAVGTVLSGLLGYREAPTLGEVLVYAAFLAVTLILFLRPAAPVAAARPVAREG